MEEIQKVGMSIPSNSRIEQAISSIIDNHFYEESLNSLLHEFVRHKRAKTSIWPELTLKTYFMLGGEDEDILSAAAQTELMILSLDILDDLQDQDQFEPPWMKAETPIAMNAATGLMVAAIAGDIGRPIHSDILKLVTIAHNGQHKDIGSYVESEEEYLELISEKSASLVAFAMRMGYQEIMNLTMEDGRKLNEIAQCVGIAAQLENDLSSIDELNSRSDLIRGKLTLATQYIKELAATDFPLLTHYLYGRCELETLQNSAQQFSSFVHSSGVYEYTRTIQILYAQKANDLLESLPANREWLEKFKELILHKYLKKN